MELISFITYSSRLSGAEDGVVAGDAVVEIVEGVVAGEIAGDHRDVADAQHSDHVLKNSSVPRNFRVIFSDN